MIKKIISIFKKLPVLIAGLSLVSTLGFATAANAVGTIPASSTSTISPDKTTNIISKGDSEIGRRLDTLNKLDSKITTSVKISASDQTTLTTEVNNEISGLTADKATLDASTTVAEAQTTAQSIFTEYRVYALVVPQVYIVKTADSQQLVEGKLTTLASGIVSALGSSTTNTTASTNLKTMQSDITSATQLSTSVESETLALNPTDYDADHTILLQYYTSLKTAQTDINNAISLAKTIISSIK